MKSNIILHVFVCLGLALALPVLSHAQDFQRISIGSHAAVWSVPQMDGFSVAVIGPEGTEIRDVDDTVLFGFRPFVRLGLIREFDIELSHEFAFGSDVDVMVSSASGIVRPFAGSGLEFHASICYGQLDWDDITAFDSSWGWEVGVGYNFRLSPSAALVIGLAYRDLSFEVDVDKTQARVKETRPEVTDVALSEDSLDAAGIVANAGIYITF
jgi:hypothetical protein